MAEIDLGKVVGATGATGPKGETGEVGPQGPPGPEGIVDGNSTINFTVPEVYQEPQSGDSIANLFGRFKRWILDIVEKIGDLTSLKTPDKKSTVAAINANYDSITQLEQDIGNPADLTTDAKEVVGAVNELNSALSKTAEDLKQANTRLNNKADQSSLNFTNTKLNVIGTVYRNIKEITVGSGGVDSYSGGASIAIPAGTYIVTAKGSFTSNASESTRRVQVYNNTKNAGISTSSCYGKNYLSFKEVCILDLTEQNILSCRLSTGIGANLAGCGTEIAAIRIK